MMKVNLDIVIGSPDNEIDMQYGLETLKGTSDVVSIAAEAILRARVPEKRTHKSDARTKLKQSFTGSYGHKFSIEIVDKELQSRLRKIGTDTFLEVLSYFVLEALYLDTGQLSPDAEALVDELSDITDKLVDRLKEPLVDTHKIANYFNYDIKLRQRKRGLPEPKELLLFNNCTAKNITDAERSDVEEEMDVVIVRFHSITGNGRFYIKAQEEIESFGFASKVRAVNDEMRKAISSNLHKNNTLPPENGEFMKVRVKRVALPTGKVIKYLITGIYV
ncbi:hypothetical protein [Vibrio parahaemolyticus]|jgi:hypothetical protein|uniref:hypothetical protein n=2 Tax=Vibrio harveyi group TaxID=717610 RepID=UPI0011220DCB|nr:hypothetical protein [Vibrio parahaemolyticus]EIK0774873.1 hypothetical protein [Vibrio alginolyticus]MBM4941575.1 hypothetical protein [Vibrio parahaemolyticus]TOI58998.1 hypothetical protein CGI55_24820 [Vibrio parahaemolyticus]HCG6987772.1 hypothetical protein [Vibrio parahaemolyticus]